MMTLFGHGVRVTDAIPDEHIMVDGGYLFIGRRATSKLYSVVRESMIGRGGDATAAIYDLMEQSETQRKSVAL